MLDELKRLITDNRLGAYERSLAITDDWGMIGAYEWNKSLSGAFWPLLQAVEISLRNTINDALINHKSTPKWFLSTFKTWHQKPLIDKKDKFIKIYSKNKINSNKVLFNGFIVSELNFGSWVLLLNSNYRDDNLLDTTALWPQLTPVAFPHAVGEEKDKLFNRYDRIRLFRNRVGHHEPLWSKSDNAQSIADVVRVLSDMHDHLIDSIRIISPERADHFRTSKQGEHLRSLLTEAKAQEFIDFSRERGQAA
ncbi:hypothetical protein GTP20_23795 [Vibrio alginolyticus]|nr:hypothetical protein [Vibrio alginolyticus]